MLLQKLVFLVTFWVLIIGHGSADSDEVLEYGMSSPTACVSDPCHPQLSPPSPSVSGYPSNGRLPPPPRPVSGYPSYGTPPPPPQVSGYPSYGPPPPPPIRLTSPSTPGQGCSPPPPPLAQCCFYGSSSPYEYLPNQNYSAASALSLSWFSVMMMSVLFALLL